MKLPPVKPFVAAVATVVAATLVRLALDPLLGDRLPLFTYFAALAFAAWYCDWPAAAVATVVGAALARYFFIAPRYTLATDAEGALALAAYFAAGGAIVALGGFARAAGRRADEQ